jgi:hypothetical protein
MIPDTAHERRARIKERSDAILHRDDSARIPEEVSGVEGRPRPQ